MLTAQIRARPTGSSAVCLTIGGGSLVACATFVSGGLLLPAIVMGPLGLLLCAIGWHAEFEPEELAC